MKKANTPYSINSQPFTNHKTRRFAAFLAALLCLALPMGKAWAQEQTLTIGTGTSTAAGSSGTPTYGSVMGNTYNYYAITQSLYTASELGGEAKTIRSLSFYHNAYSFTTNLTIYLVHWSGATITSSTAVTSGTAYYTGTGITVGGSSAGWQTFTLDQPFEYNGTSNLLVVVVRSHSSGYKTSQGWQYSSTTSTQHIVRSSDTEAYGVLSNGNSTYAYTQSTNRPNIKIGYTVACKPKYTATGDYIASFSTTGATANINNTSNAQGTNGYSDFYSTHSATAKAGQTVGFTITNNTTDAYKYAIWVDWNKDGDYDDSGETMVSQSTDISGAFTGSFTVPSNTADGEYRMRVEMSYYIDLSPCIQGGYGEVEDYKLIV